jgi:hypothetical protein
MRYYDELEYRVTEQIYELKRYAVNYRDGSLHRPYTPYDYATVELRAALVKDQTKSFVPIREQFEDVCFTVPNVIWDHLKLMLPRDLQFGWLRLYLPILRSVPNKTTITINSYTVYVAPNDQRVVVAKMPKFEIDRKYFREVRK